MFRVVLPPSIRSAYNCIYSIWYLSHRYCYLPLVTVWQIPDAVDTVVYAPDDGWWYHPKHVEQILDKINCVTLHVVGYILEYRKLNCVRNNSNNLLLYKQWWTRNKWSRFLPVLHFLIKKNSVLGINLFKFKSFNEQVMNCVKVLPDACSVNRRIHCTRTCYTYLDVTIKYTSPVSCLSIFY
jgi:hypothetical protein